MGNCKNIIVNLSYNGYYYNGFQKQPHTNHTVQNEIESILSVICNEDIIIHPAGRTDKGVHALNQYLIFSTSSDIKLNKIYTALNSMSSENLLIKNIAYSDNQFHPRYNSVGKKYLYKINKDIQKSIFRNTTHLNIRESLDIGRLNEILNPLIGKHDFSSFVASGHSTTSSIRTIYNIDVNENEDEINILFYGSGFLYKMIRLIIGTTLDIYNKKHNLSIQEILASKSRQYTTHVTSPYGLYLYEVYFDNKFIFNWEKNIQ